MVEELMDEDYPSSFDMEHFKSLTSFNKRIQYCKENLKRISSGSGRIVYMIDYGLTHDVYDTYYS